MKNTGKDGNTPGFMKAYEKDKVAQAEQNVDYQSIRDRLMSRNKTLVLEVPLKDEAGEFNVKCRAFTVKEQSVVFGLLDELFKLSAAQKDPKVNSPEKVLERYKQAMATARSLIAYPTGICLDSELTLEFWGGGDYTSDLPFYIMRYVLDHQNEAVRNAMLFRKKQ